MRTHRHFSLSFHLLAASLLLLGCRPGAREDSDATAPEGSAATTSNRAPSATPSARQERRPPTPPAPAERKATDFSPVTFESVQQLQHRIIDGHRVHVDLHPYCQPERPMPGHLSVGNSQTWLGRRGLAEYTSLHETLASEPSYIGVAPEEERRYLVAVFEPDFQDWASIQEKLPGSTRFPIELRPGCHTSKQREAAEQVLREFQEERPWGAALHAWTPDVTNAGLRIFVLPGEVSTERRVKERLGTIANVWFSRRFGAHGPRPSSR